MKNFIVQKNVVIWVLKNGHFQTILQTHKNYEAECLVTMCQKDQAETH